MTGKARSAREAFGGLTVPPPAAPRPAAEEERAKPAGPPEPARPRPQMHRTTPTNPPFGTVADVPLSQRPRKTTLNLTLTEEEKLEDLIRQLRRRTGRAVSKDETWRALLVWADSQADVEDLARILTLPSSRDDGSP
jgi:hypothetical protein